MSTPHGYARDQLRLAYTDAWRKHLDGVPLSPQEAAIVDVITLHPEYQALVADPGGARDFDPAGRPDQQNPFLHMGLHLAVRDQIAVDRPPGIRSLYRDLQARRADAHAAEHALMEALGEVLWQAQRDGQAPDEQQYLALARRRAGT